MKTEAATTTTFDIEQIRAQFPVLHQQVNKHQLVYMDNAATTQKPQVVLDALNDYYTGFNSNIHRGVHTLAERATTAFEATRKAAQRFVNAAEPQEIIFTKGCTDGINLVASSFGRSHIKAGDEIIITAMEHHSNIVPWQMLCQERGATLRVVPVTEAGEMQMDAFEQLLSEKTKLVSVVHASNALGTVNPVKEIIQKAHAVGAVVLLDGAQAASHLEVDVQALDADFYVMSGHKVYGPTGTGILYGKRRLLEAMPPYQGGGEMIKEVTFEGTTYNDIPFKFEAGTPNISDIVAFRYALEWVESVGKANIAAHEQQLLQKAHELLQEVPGLRLVGTAREKVSVASFILDGVHPFDVGMMLDARGIAIRTGHHCTQPLMKRLNIEGTARASFAVYNTLEEVGLLAEGLQYIAKRMR
ncbi:cysteine desulfurase [Cesiribacter sp. SM1]|uniref:cysteine desulfurase n=1 Tax=Cesiribacter sp. SM1 TaxID=2861196 RepID=UPI001CD4A073|nr:cysteine desulfurase [Cesiribacter sp. SM1]